MAFFRICQMAMLLCWCTRSVVSAGTSATFMIPAGDPCKYVCRSDPMRPPFFEKPNYHESFMTCAMYRQDSPDQASTGGDCHFTVDLVEEINKSNLNQSNFVHVLIEGYRTKPENKLRISFNHSKYAPRSYSNILTRVYFANVELDYSGLAEFSEITRLLHVVFYDVIRLPPLDPLPPSSFQYLNDFTYVVKEGPWGDIEQVRPFLNVAMPNLMIAALVNVSVSSEDASLIQRNWFNVQSLQVADAGLSELMSEFPWNVPASYQYPYGLARSSTNQAHYTLDGLLDLDKHSQLGLIDLRYNEIKVLSDCRFGRTSRLHSIRLSHNSISSVSRGCFDEQPSVQFLDFANNQLTTLDRDMFNSMVSLRKLDLSFNSISDIYGLFQNLTSLLELNLANNRIHTIPQNMFMALADLRVLFLSNNRLMSVDANASSIGTTVFAGASALRELYLSGNSLEDIPVYVLFKRHLDHLDLSNNSIIFDKSQIYEFGVSAEHLRYYRAANADDALYERSQAENLRSSQKPQIVMRNNALKLTFPRRNYFSGRITSTLLSLFRVDLTGTLIACDNNASFIQGLLLGSIGSDTNLPTDPDDFRTWVCGDPYMTKNKLFLDTPVTEFASRRTSIEYCPENTTCYEAYGLNGLVECYSCGMNAFPERFPLPFNEGKNITVVFVGTTIPTLPATSSLSNITSLTIRNSKLSSIDEHAIPFMSKLMFLDISDNRLLHLPEAIQNLQLQKLHLGGNQWPCDCTQAWMKQWLLRLIKEGVVEQINALEIACRSGPRLGQGLITLEEDQFVCIDGPGPELIWAMVGMATFLILILITLGLLYRYFTEIKILLFVKFNLHPFDRVDDSDPAKEFDAFISYSSLDNNWVLKTLRPALENSIKPPMRVCIHERDFRVGQAIIENIFESVKKSRRMIVVVSKNFVTSDWCMLEFRAAHEKVLKELRAYMILILLDDVEEEDLDDSMRAYLNTNTYLHVKNKWFWDKLLYSLPQVSKPRLDGVLPPVTDNLCGEEDDDDSNGTTDDRESDSVDTKGDGQVTRQVSDASAVSIDLDKFSASPKVGGEFILSKDGDHTNPSYEPVVGEGTDLDPIELKHAVIV